MSIFTYKPTYFEGERKVLEINVLPEKYCNFDCVFCPIGRSYNHTDEAKDFENMDKAIAELGEKIHQEKPQLVFINSMGEAFVNSRLEDIIKYAQGEGVAVRLLSNGYLFGNEKYKAVANICEEVIGEIKAVTEEDFQKMQRPLAGYTLEKYIENMAEFNKQYKGDFIFEVTIIKDKNDDTASVEKLKEIIGKIKPEKLEIVRIEDEPFKAKLCADDERFAEIVAELEQM